MNQTLTIEIPEAETARFTSLIEKRVTALQQMESDDEPRWREIGRLRTEANVLMKQLKELMNVEATL
jgi:hypothetical protein